MTKNVIYNKDALEQLSLLDSDSVDLVFTSPPYADRRKEAYGGLEESKYVEWFLPIAAQIKRVLKPTGSFFLNIKPHTDNQERSLYVFDLVLSLKRTLGFKFVEEYCWTKNAFPGKLNGRFKNGFEPIYHFIKGDLNTITFNPLACGTPIKEESLKRAKRKQCGLPDSGSQMAAIKGDNLLKLTVARPSNVINVNNVSNQFSAKKLHPAVFPDKLAEFFILSFSNEGDTVLDPFAGSGTTAHVSKLNNRHYIVIEKELKYCNLMKELLK